MERLPLDSIPPVLREHVGYLLAQSHHALHGEANRAIDTVGGLSIKHHGCLAVIADEGPISQQELAARIIIDRTTMVGLVDDLESRGLVTRARNPQDRRAYALVVTDAGREWIATAAKALAEAEAEMFQFLDSDEREELRRLLQKLLTGEG